VSSLFHGLKLTAKARKREGRREEDGLYFFTFFAPSFALSRLRGAFDFPIGTVTPREL